MLFYMQDFVNIWGGAWTQPKVSHFLPQNFHFSTDFYQIISNYHTFLSLIFILQYFLPPNLYFLQLSTP